MPAHRYQQLIAIVRAVQPETIIEIGVWNGNRAIEMVAEALKHHERVHYTGYDLFEEANEHTNETELNAKPNQTLASVTARLENYQRNHPGFTFTLVRGNTNETLKPGVSGADLVYIDGGHSVETIENDYAAVRNSPVVVFDDYYRPDGSGNCADLSVFGANQVVDAHPDGRVLPSVDPLNVGGTVHLAIIGWGDRAPVW